MIMRLMRNEKVIIEVKRERNLFTLNLADPRKIMIVINPPNNTKYYVIAMTRQGRPIYLVSQSKYI